MKSTKDGEKEKEKGRKGKENNPSSSHKDGTHPKELGPSRDGKEERKEKEKEKTKDTKVRAKERKERAKMGKEVSLGGWPGRPSGKTLGTVG